MSKILLGFVAVVLVLSASAARADFNPNQPLDLKFKAVDGRQVDLAQLRGKVVLIDFWATWCPPCRAEVPEVVDIYKKYHGKGFEIVGISLDQDKTAMQAFTANHDMNWPQYFDGKGWDNAISSSFGVDQIPAMILIGKDGKIVPPDTDPDLSHALDRLLKAG